VVYQENFQSTLIFLKQTLRKGDILLTLGAGDVLKIGELLLESGTDE
jgi:UDP-N-acetylmuramate--alanine ligase